MQCAFSLWMILALAHMAVGSDWLVEGGTLSPGGHLTADHLVIGAQARLAGSGEFTGNLTFFSGSVWQLAVRGDSDVDQLLVQGTVSGATTIHVIAQPEAIPLAQTILLADPTSTLDAVQTDAPATWRLDRPGPGQLTITLPGGDRDADGLPDEWEVLHFQDRVTAAPTADDDRDQAPNLAEYLSGTLPLETTSVLALTGLRPQGTTWRLTWPSAAGRAYRILQGESPAGPYDQVLATEPATPPLNTFDPPPSLPNPVFFRVEIAP